MSQMCGYGSQMSDRPRRSIPKPVYCSQPALLPGVCFFRRPPGVRGVFAIGPPPRDRFVLTGAGRCRCTPCRGFSTRPAAPDPVLAVPLDLPVAVLVDAAAPLVLLRDGQDRVCWRFGKLRPAFRCCGHGLCCHGGGGGAICPCGPPYGDCIAAGPRLNGAGLAPPYELSWSLP